MILELVSLDECMLTGVGTCALPMCAVRRDATTDCDWVRRQRTLARPPGRAAEARDMARDFPGLR
jgi:hypothetical protein